MIPGLALAAILVTGSGVALSRAGRPFGKAILSVHKLVDLAAIVAIGVTVYDATRVGSLSRVAIAATGTAGAFLLISLVTGGIASASDKAPRWVTWVHRIGSWITLLITAWWAVLFLA